MDVELVLLYSVAAIRAEVGWVWLARIAYYTSQHCVSAHGTTRMLLQIHWCYLCLIRHKV